jgi:hypothetical protein
MPQQVVQQAPVTPVAELQELTPAQKAKQSEIKRLAALNDKLEQELARATGFSLDQSSSTKLVVMALLSVLFPDDTEEGVSGRLAHELKYQQMLGQVLEDGRQQLMQARLAAGTLSPEMMAELTGAARLASGPERRTRKG